MIFLTFDWSLFFSLFGSKLKVLVSEYNIWSAITALGTIITLFFIYRQISNTSATNTYNFARKEDDRFCSEEMRQNRHNLAKTLILYPDDYEQIDEYADYILGYFEDLGVLTKKGGVIIYFIWSMNSYYVINYWKVLEKYINWVRKDYKQDPYYYTDFEYLHKKVLKMEERFRRKKIEVSEVEIRDFLEEELYVEYRLFSLSDIGELMKIEKSSFKNDSYPKSQLKELFEKYPEEFFVATIFGKILGYMVGYISDGIGEIDSLTVDSCYRHLGIGKNLFMLIFKKFRKQGINEFSLEVRTTSEAAIQFYKKLGFKIIETLKDYYDDKGDAYLMKMHI